MSEEVKSYEVFQVNFRIEDEVPVNQEELQTYNYEFLGNKVNCDVVLHEDSRLLSYKIPATLPITTYMTKQLYRGEFLSIMASIMKQLLFFEDNDMPVEKVLLNRKYMYIELATMDVQLLYMPIDKKFNDLNVCEFIQHFIRRVRFADMQCVTCVDQILQYLDSSMIFSLRDFYNFILELLQEQMLAEELDDSSEDDTSVLVSQREYKNVVPYLVRLRTNALIPIEKSEFTIGKSSESDYQVTDNKKISRRHCSLKVSNGECYIRDNESTNHTYVNGKLILPGVDVMLKNDDYIRMADEEFKYWVK